MAKKEIPYRNRNHTGWWVYGWVEQWVGAKRGKLLPTSRCPVWENTCLVQANDREEAYRKAIKLSKAGMPCKTFGGEWRFAGLSMLLPVYDELEDGAEIFWDDRGLMSVGRIAKMVKSKRDLKVFDDSEKD